VGDPLVFFYIGDPVWWRYTLAGIMAAGGGRFIEAAFCHATGQSGATDHCIRGRRSF